MLRTKYIVNLLFAGVILVNPASIMADSNPNGPEVKTELASKKLAFGKHSMVVTNNQWSSEAAQQILQQGGNATDAAIAAGFVLGLTEPQSSGIGGGGYALTYNKKTKTMVAYDGRETAPKSATPNLFLNKDGLPQNFKDAYITAEAIGVPGEVAMFYKMHKEQGKLPWARLLEPAITLANNGFPMSQRLYGILQTESALLTIPEVKDLYFTSDNKVKPIGTIIKNPVYANSLQRIAANPQDFYTGKLARDIINAVNAKAHKGIYTQSDLSSYTVRIYQPVCSSYRGQYKICSVPPSSGGGVTLLELMGIYANVYSGHNINDEKWAYNFLEASKLAYADRNQYLADPNFVKQPVAGILNSKYIQSRSDQISNMALATPVAPGIPVGVDKTYAPDSVSKAPGTTAIAIVDKNGNAVSMTVTIENQFGSHTFVDGFFLNNELTDFSFTPTDTAGHLVANRVEAGKRPRSSIASTLVFDKNNDLKILAGSPGGSPIICYVAKNLIQMLDLGQNPLQAASSGNLCAINQAPVIEAGTTLTDVIPAIKQQGESVTKGDLVSGEVNIMRTKNSWVGAADPRREGIALGN